MPGPRAEQTDGYQQIERYQIIRTGKLENND